MVTKFHEQKFENLVANI